MEDPDFQDRPQTDDFNRLSNVVLKLDGAVVEGQQTIEEVLGGLIDSNSLSYLATHRTLRIAQLYGISLSIPVASALAGMFVNGVAAGILFEQEGGHRG